MYNAWSTYCCCSLATLLLITIKKKKLKKNNNFSKQKKKKKNGLPLFNELLLDDELDDTVEFGVRIPLFSF